MSRLEQIRQEKNDVANALRETNSELLTLIQSRKALSEGRNRFRESFALWERSSHSGSEPQKIKSQNL